MITQRTVVKIEHRPSPNGRYPITISFAKDGQWHDANYTQTIEQAWQWVMAEIERAIFAGPIIEIKSS